MSTGKKSRFLALGLVALLAVVWAAFGINALLTWTPPKPDPRSITRENFRFEMFSRSRLLGLETEHDVEEARDKLNELFPPGTLLDEFIAFEKSIKIQPSGYEHTGKNSFECNFSHNKNEFICSHLYNSLGVIGGENTWMTFTHIDENRSIRRIDVKLFFMW